MFLTHRGWVQFLKIKQSSSNALLKEFVFGSNKVPIYLLGGEDHWHRERGAGCMRSRECV